MPAVLLLGGLRDRLGVVTLEVLSGNLEFLVLGSLYVDLQHAGLVGLSAEKNVLEREDDVGVVEHVVAAHGSLLARVWPGPAPR